MSDIYRARIHEIISVIDGDSLRVVLDLGWRIYQITDVRLANLNAPEVTGLERQAGLAVRLFTENWIERRPSGLWLDSFKWPEGRSKYGQSLGLIVDRSTTDLEGSATLNTQLLVHGLAKPYDGNGPMPRFGGIECEEIVRKVEELLK